MHMDMCTCSSVHDGPKIASDLPTFLSVRTENNTKLIIINNSSGRSVILLLALENY